MLTSAMVMVCEVNMPCSHARTLLTQGLGFRWNRAGYQCGQIPSLRGNSLAVAGQEAVFRSTQRDSYGEIGWHRSCTTQWHRALVAPSKEFKMLSTAAMSPFHVEWSLLATYAGLWVFAILHILAAFMFISRVSD